MRLLSTVLLLLLGTQVSFAQIPSGYYDDASGQTGYTLKTTLSDIIDGHNDRGYSALWTLYQTADVRSDGFVWEIYSDCNLQFGTDQDGGSGGTTECDKYNREHTFPQNWFGGSGTARNDGHMVMPSDKKVNSIRGNFPYGEVASADYTSGNGSKRGTSAISGYSGTVFEPADEFKGDLARIYFYMATRYETSVTGWSSAMLNGTSNQVYTDWAIDMLYDWHVNDPVSQKEIDRNNDVYDHQSNRNPYVDHPEYVASVWGFSSATPTVSFDMSTGSISEGNSGSTTYQAMVILSQSSSSAVTVNISADNAGTATSGVDYTLSTTSLTFSAGETSKNVSVSILGDTDEENNETVVLELNNPSGAVLGTATSHALTILNDDEDPSTIAFTSASGNIDEGDSGNSTYQIAVTLSESQSNTVSVNIFADNAGTATSGVDYTLSTTSLTFNAGETSKMVSVSIIGDVTEESDETIVLNLTSLAGNASLGTAIHTVTINNDDVAPSDLGFVSASGNLDEGNSGNSTYQIEVALSESQSNTVSVNISADNASTATSGVDYMLSTTSLTFNAGETSKMVSVSIIGDTDFESAETIILNLTDLSGNATLGAVSHTITINNDDATPVPSMGFASSTGQITEGNSGTKTYEVSVNLTSVPSSSVFVNVSIDNGSTATVGTDYTVSATSLTFSTSETSKTFSVTVFGDVQDESDETLILNLEGLSGNATLGSVITHTLTISDDDNPLPIISFDASGGSFTEAISGQNDIYETQISISSAPTAPVTVQLSIDNASTAGSADYQLLTPSVTFNSTTTTQIVQVKVTFDSETSELDETLVLKLGTLTGSAQIGANDTHTLTILNRATGTEEELAQLGMQFYPNPAKSAIAIDFANFQKPYAVELYSLEGKKLKIYTVGEAQIRLGFPQLNAGMYLLKVIIEGKAYMKRIVVE